MDILDLERTYFSWPIAVKGFNFTTRQETEISSFPELEISQNQAKQIVFYVLCNDIIRHVRQ